MSLRDEQDALVEHYARGATQNLYRYKGLREAIRAEVDELCDCGSVTGCQDTRARELLLSILERADES